MASMTMKSKNAATKYPAILFISLPPYIGHDPHDLV